MGKKPSLLCLSQQNVKLGLGRGVIRSTRLGERGVSLHEYCSCFVLIGRVLAAASQAPEQWAMMGLNARWPVSRVLSPPDAGDDHSSGTSVTGRLARPTRTAARKCALPARADIPSLLGLAPGGVYLATRVTAGAVRSYRTLSPLPQSGRGASLRRFAFCGTVPGVAPAGRYPAPYFRGARTFLPSFPKSGHPAIWRGQYIE